MATYLAIVPNYWARDPNPAKALAEVRKLAGINGTDLKRTPYRIYECEDEAAWCEEVSGNIMHRKGTKVSLFEKYDPPTKVK